MFRQLAERYQGWTPETINNLTLPQALLYAETNERPKRFKGGRSVGSMKEARELLSKRAKG